MIDLKKTMRDVASFSEKQRQFQLKKLKSERSGSRKSLTGAIIVAYEKVIESMHKMLAAHEEEEENE